ncbi:MAG: bifunctional 2-methylcitrate dehydratase/aconitate hydratase [Nitrospinota bacterium]
MSSNFDLSNRPPADKVLVDIADYVLDYKIESDLAYNEALNAFVDTLGCGLLALNFRDCVRHLGPVVEGTTVPLGSRVPGRSTVLDPIKAAWDIGVMVRWLDFNDTWLAAEWGHPSDNLGAILSLSDYLSQKAVDEGKEPLTIKELLGWMIKAYEIQGVIALENSFNRVGIDHVILVRVASTAVSAAMLGATKDQIISAISHAWVDGSALRTYRHAPNASSRKSWAAGDATARGLFLALLATRDEIGLPSALTAKQWGFYDVVFKGNQFSLPQKYATYVMENILYKISFPAEFHAQTAVEAALTLHSDVKDRFDQIDRIELTTHESAIRIISKVGELANFADRDHCLQYMVAVGLIEGKLISEYYEDDYYHRTPLIDQLRDKMVVQEDKRYSKEYLESDKRSIANSVQIFFKDGTSSAKVEVEYPIGHKRRRDEGIPLLRAKFLNNLKEQFSEEDSKKIYDLAIDLKKIESIPVNQFLDMLVTT